MGRRTDGRNLSARARGLRTLQHQTLPSATRRGIDTEVWFRALLRSEGVGAHARWATKDQVHDEALEWFLLRHAKRPPRSYPPRRDGDEDLTFWVDSRLLQRARRMATRDGVRLARLIDAALSGYVQQHVGARLARFRARVERQARALHQGAEPALARRKAAAK